MNVRSTATFLTTVIFFLLGLYSAEACMGVSRTINVKSFHANLGMGGSGGIGLRHKEVVLTFDDGPVQRTTPRVLAALDRECIKATFFVVGEMAQANPKLLQRIVRAGHTIGHHTQTHENLTNMSRAAAKRQIENGIASVRKGLGRYRNRSSKLFRYPYLARSAALDSILRRKGLLPLSAAVMSQDWKDGSGSGMVGRVMSGLKKTGRGVILLHDIQSKTANALPGLLRRLKRDGYKIVHLRSGRSAGSVAVASLSTKKKRGQRFRRTKSNDLPGVKIVRRKHTSGFGLASFLNRRSARTSTIDKTTTGSVRKSTKSKKAKSRTAKKRRKTAKAGPKNKRRSFASLFKRNSTRRRDGESAYAYRTRMRKLNLKSERDQNAKSTR